MVAATGAVQTVVWAAEVAGSSGQAEKQSSSQVAIWSGSGLEVHHLVKRNLTAIPMPPLLEELCLDRGKVGPQLILDMLKPLDVVKQTSFVDPVEVVASRVVEVL